MEFYIVTDPCYILPDEVWSKACQDIFDNDREDLEGFNARIQEDLRKFTDTDEAWVDETGAGDWCNSIYGKHIMTPEFCADSGMVCICRITKPIMKAVNDKALHKYCYAVFQAHPGIEVNFDRTDKGWTVVRVYSNGEEIVTSEGGNNDGDNID